MYTQYTVKLCRAGRGEGVVDEVKFTLEEKVQSWCVINRIENEYEHSALINPTVPP